MDEKEIPPDTKEDLVSSSNTITNGSPDSSKEDLKRSFNCGESTEASSSHKTSDELIISIWSQSEVIGTTTPLHEAAQSGDAHKVLELLEQGLDPCIKDERGWTPYVLANEKEVRNSFRRFMAANIDMWDWHAANVPSALTKEMEESQAAKQVILFVSLLVFHCSLTIASSICIFFYLFSFGWKYNLGYHNFFPSITLSLPRPLLRI